MRSKFRWYTGVGAVLVGVIGLLPQVLPSFDLRPLVIAGITTFGALVVIVVGLWRSHVADLAADDVLRATLDGALACWPPRTAAQLTPYDLGAHPTGDDEPARGAEPPVLPDYVGRTADPALRAAVAAGEVVVAYGPPRAGKTRSLYQALLDVRPAPLLLAPEDADGLRTALANVEDVPRLIGVKGAPPLVLWLDELARFLPGLDLDALDRLAAEGTPVRIVATIGEQELSALLDERDAGDGHPDRHRARRLLARARAIHLEPPSAAEPTAATAAARTGSLRGHGDGGWWPAPVRPVALPARPARLTPAMWGVGALAVAALAATAAYALAHGLKTPPDIAQQLTDLRTGGAECEQATVSPRDASAVTRRTVVVAAVDRSLCPGPDELRLYRKDVDRLERVTTLRLPADAARRSLACIGVQRGDDCAVTVEGHARVIVGAFADPQTRQAVPVAASFVDGALHLASLAPRPPSGDPSLDAGTVRVDRRRVVLPLDGAPAHGGCGRARERCVAGYGAQTWDAFPAVAGSRPAVVVAGYLARGSEPEAPSELRMRAWRLTLQAGAPALRQRCWIFAGGARLPLVAPISSGGDAGAQMAVAWRRLLKGGAVVC
ncbi:MAG: hypothetical protein JSS99_07095 [Actinobacteria bacterium]|nr:hypothetical protein [Actinomycetota bacterium]